MAVGCVVGDNLRCQRFLSVSVSAVLSVISAIAARKHQQTGCSQAMHIEANVEDLFIITFLCRISLASVYAFVCTVITLLLLPSLPTSCRVGSS